MNKRIKEARERERLYTSKNEYKETKCGEKEWKEWENGKLKSKKLAGKTNGRKREQN